MSEANGRTSPKSARSDRKTGRDAPRTPRRHGLGAAEPLAVLAVLAVLAALACASREGNDLDLTDGGVASDAEVMHDAGEAPPPSCSLTGVEIAPAVTTSAEDGTAPIDLAVFDGRIYVTWFSTLGLVLREIDLDGGRVDGFELPNARGRSPRLFMREGDARPSVLFVSEPSPSSQLAEVVVWSPSGPFSIQLLDGPMYFGLEAGRRASELHPALVLAARPRNAQPYAELRPSDRMAPVALPGTHALASTFDLAGTGSGWLIAAWTDGAVDLLRLDAGDPNVQVVARLGTPSRRLLPEVLVRSADPGAPVVFFADEDDGLASLWLQRSGEPDPVLVQRNAGGTDGFGASAAAVQDGGWAMMWSDFRDTYSGGGSAVKSLYFARLDTDGTPAAEDPRDRRVVPAVADDLTSPRLAVLGPEQYAAVYLAGPSRSLHFVSGDFETCVAVDDASVQEP